MPEVEGLDRSPEFYSCNNDASKVLIEMLWEKK
jgi:hypothetical protein